MGFKYSKTGSLSLGKAENRGDDGEKLKNGDQSLINSFINFTVEVLENDPAE
jgi:hypothetical protein